MSNNLVMIGCDPEVFVKDDNTDEFVSAHGLIYGTKANPFKVDRGAVQVDGMACEFNTDPTNKVEEFVENVQMVTAQLKQMLPSNLSLSIGTPTATFSPEVMKQQPAEALELGCEPDYNAYTVRANPRPNGAATTMRTAAGHVHVGFKDVVDVFGLSHMLDCANLTMALDIFLGLLSLSYDTDKKRRKLYGKAGAFRPKPYGAEYRVLSNAWLKSPVLTAAVFTVAQEWGRRIASGETVDPEQAAEARKIINKSDATKAETLYASLCQEYGVENLWGVCSNVSTV